MTQDPRHSAPEDDEFLALDEEAETYWDIVWTQFGKYKLSFYALFGVIALFLLAVYAPLIALDLPFYFSRGDETSYPWLVHIFNRVYFEGTIDVLFNSLIFLLPISAAIIFGFRVASRKLPKRDRRRANRNGILVALAVSVLANVYLIAFPYETEYPSAKDEIESIETAQSELPEARAERKSLPGEPGTYIHTRLINTGVGFPFVSRKTVELTAEDIAESQAEADAKIADLEKQASTEISYLFPPVPYSFMARTKEFRAEASSQHYFGTDHLGRDNFTRMLFGTRIALTVGIVAVSIYIFIGILFGSLAGYFGGWVDMVIMRFIEIMMCFPSFFLILTLAAFVDEPSIFYVMVIIGVTRWTGVARLVRGEFLRLRNQEFVQAAKALGLPEWRIIFRHILPNALGPVLVAASFGVASAILIESTLSFLGLGDRSSPTWGLILNDGRVYRNELMIILPGLAIFVTVSLFNLMGDGLRDALDPKLRK